MHAVCACRVAQQQGHTHCWTVPRRQLITPLGMPNFRAERPPGPTCATSTPHMLLCATVLRAYPVPVDAPPILLLPLNTALPPSAQAERQAARPPQCVTGGPLSTLHAPRAHACSQGPLRRPTLRCLHPMHALPPPSAVDATALRSVPTPTQKYQCTSSLHQRLPSLNMIMRLSSALECQACQLYLSSLCTHHTSGSHGHRPSRGCGCPGS